MSETYGLRLGPLRFVTAMSDVVETLGDQLEQVGPSLVAGDRRPRPFNLEIPVRAAAGDPDPRATGMRMRRQVRQLMENTRWRMQGLPFSWDIDPDLDCWLLVGGGDLTEIQGGLTFGEFKLSLTDCYIAGRPGTHLSGYRFDYGDRRTGLVPIDSWAENFEPVTGAGSVILNKDSFIVPYVADPLHDGFLGLLDQPFPSGTVRTVRSAMPQPDGGERGFGPLEIGDFGACRLWAMPAGLPASPTAAGNLNPDRYYGWHRVAGPRVDPSSPLVIDNGLCRVMPLVDSGTTYLQAERNQNPYAAVTAQNPEAPYSRPVSVMISPAVGGEWVPIEVTPERVVIEVSGGQYQFRPARIILQRGWTGPRIEVRGDHTEGGLANELLVMPSAGGTVAATTLPFVWEVKDSSGGRLALAASGTSRTASSVTGYTAKFNGSRENGLVMQLSLGTKPSGENPATDMNVYNGSRSWPFDRFASLVLDDARSVPVLVER